MSNKQIEAVNGTNSGTIIAEKQLLNTKLELHYNPTTKQLVEMNTWWESDGECVSKDFEVLGVYDTIGEAVRLSQSYGY